jgi:hypothetical protein
MEPPSLRREFRALFAERHSQDWNLALYQFQSELARADGPDGPQQHKAAMIYLRSMRDRDRAIADALGMLAEREMRQRERTDDGADDASSTGTAE